MICCGKDVLTPYCPMCGKQSDDPLAGLLDHLRTRLGVYEEQQKAQQQEVESLGEKATKYDRNRLERVGLTVAKWRSWLDALESLVAKQKETNK